MGIERLLMSRWGSVARSEGPLNGRGGSDGRQVEGARSLFGSAGPHFLIDRGRWRSRVRCQCGTSTFDRQVCGPDGANVS